MQVRKEVFPHIAVAVGVGAVIVIGGIFLSLGAAASLLIGGGVGLALSGYLLYFFRDPERTSPGDPTAVVAAADGRVAAIVPIPREAFAAFCERSGLGGVTSPAMERLRGGDVLRVSIFLSLFDVHVNRAPITGIYEFLGYFPGRRFFTFKEKSSTENQRNAILIHNERTVCLLQQIVGPVARRVVYWPDSDRPVGLKIGERIGMMKFGSRLDMCFPAGDLDLNVREGDLVTAGETVIGRLRMGQ